MIAYAYFDKDYGVRIFKDNVYIADLPLDAPTEREADKSLHAMRLYRRGKWYDREWGKEARVRFK